MRRMLPKQVEAGRILDGPMGTPRSYGANGSFRLPLPSGESCLVIASDGAGWDHVSVSLPDRCPTWDEMAHIKSLFWEDFECVMELHQPRADYINNHPYCLHLWKPHTQCIPRPPSYLVGKGELCDEARKA